MEYKRKIFPEEVALIAFLASKAQFQLESKIGKINLSLILSQKRK